MALLLPHTSFNELKNNFQATPALVNFATRVTASGSTHTKGSWSSMIDPVPSDCYWLNLMIGGVSQGNTRTEALVDIAIGPTGGGSEQVILPNLLAGWSGANPLRNGERVVSVPMYIPAGLRVSGRCQSAIASDTVDLGLALSCGFSGPPWAAFTCADAYGVDTATSMGTAVTAGNSGTEGSWTNIGSTTSRDYYGLYILVQSETTGTTMTSLAYHFEIGYSSTTLAEFLFMTDSNEWTNGPFPAFPYLGFIPSGTQLQVRGECSSSAEVLDVALYGLY